MATGVSGLNFNPSATIGTLYSSSLGITASVSVELQAPISSGTLSCDPSHTGASATVSPAVPQGKAVAYSADAGAWTSTAHGFGSAAAAWRAWAQSAICSCPARASSAPRRSRSVSDSDSVPSPKNSTNMQN